MRAATCILMLCLLFLPRDLSAQGLAPPDSVVHDRRSAIRDVAGGVRDLGVDAWDWVSAPSRWNSKQTLQFGAIAATGVLIFAFDEEIHDWVARNQDEAPWRYYLDVGNFLEPAAQMNNSNPYLAAGIGVTWIFGWEPYMRVMQQMLYANLISGASMVIVRPLVGRSRPRDSADPYVFEFGQDGTSFPSGHTSSAFILARVLSRQAGWWPVSVVLYGLAGSVAYQRLAVTYNDSGEIEKSAAHWPSDVWFGMWWGLSVADVVIGNSEERFGRALRTGYDHRTGTMTVTLQFRF